MLLPCACAPPPRRQRSSLVLLGSRRHRGAGSVKQHAVDVSTLLISDGRIDPDCETEEMLESNLRGMLNAEIPQQVQYICFVPPHLL